MESSNIENQGSTSPSVSDDTPAQRTNSIGESVTFQSPPQTSPLSATASILANSQSNNSNHQRQKRARSQLSCTPCRQGKLKCNRQHEPACDQCIKRNREDACIYVPPPVKHKPPQNVKGRIRQLENLVVDLMNQNRNAQRGQQGTDQKSRGGRDENEAGQQQKTGPYSQPTPPSDTETSAQLTEQGQGSGTSPPSDIDAATTPFGRMRISKDEISYVGDTHWGAILNSITELKRDLGNDDDNAEDADGADGDADDDLPSAWAYDYWKGNHGLLAPQVSMNDPNGLGFILGAATPMSKEMLIKAVPEKKVMDRLLSLWFNSPDPFKPVIHAPTFQDEYRRFCRDPKQTPVMWLGLLYSIMSLAASFGLRDVDPACHQAKEVLAEVMKYHNLAASAAVLADFTKPKQYTLECLILWAAGLRSNNAFVNVWLVIGLCVRLALRMGYHRDPSHYPAITAFEGEMRRRCWALISMIDVLISFQLGLPSMVKTLQSDTQPPRNLLDRDFNPLTKTLPPSRGIDELTPSSYTRAKLRIVRIFANATELSHATISPSQEEMMTLDRELEEAKTAIPPLLQMPEISELVTDPAEQLMCRFNLDLLYLKTKLVLHRRYMLTPFDQLSPEEQRRGIGDSRKLCTEAALRVLQHHHTIYMASQSGGQLESVKWYMGSISTHDFLLAAMVICLELSTQINVQSFAENPRTGIQCPKRRELMEALDKSQHIWATTTSRKRETARAVKQDSLQKGEELFDETEKASRAMAVMVQKVKRQFGMHADTPPPQQAAPSPMPAPITQTQAAPPNTNSDTMNADQPSAPRPLVFSGMISNHQWGNLDGVGDAYVDLGGAPFTNGGDAQGLPNNPITFGSDAGNQSRQTSTETSPEQNDFGPQDFSMIGDMLDVPVNLDWEMWDQEIVGSNGGNTTSGVSGESDESTFLFTAPSNPAWNGDYPFVAKGRYAGNALTGGTGPIAPSAGATAAQNGDNLSNFAIPPNPYGSSAFDFRNIDMGDDDIPVDMVRYGL